jgi:hypothetical protein
MNVGRRRRLGAAAGIANIISIVTGVRLNIYQDKSIFLPFVHFHAGPQAAGAARAGTRWKTWRSPVVAGESIAPCLECHYGNAQQEATIV